MASTEPTEDTLDELAAKALASMILYATAEVMAEDSTISALALAKLSDTSGLSLEICAGVMLATSTLVGAGSITAEEVATAAVQYEADALEAAQEGAEQ
jgi:hypothetical protein